MDITPVTNAIVQQTAANVKPAAGMPFALPVIANADAAGKLALPPVTHPPVRFFPTPLNHQAMSLLHAQQAQTSSAASTTSPQTAAQKFMQLQQETTGDRMRDEALGAMGLTEQQVEAMPASERAKVSAAIKARVEDKLTK